MTIAVIGIALALPAALDVTIRSFAPLATSLQKHASISVFLKHGIGDQEAGDIALVLRKRPNVAAVDLIPAPQALQEFKILSGLGAALDNLEENPLPTTLILTPTGDGGDKESLQRLVADITSLPGVDTVQIDAAWLERLQALFQIAGKIMGVLSAFFVLAVVIVVANTVRLLTELHRENIHIAKLVGATDAYVLRPFLYTGLLLGLTGGALALGLVQAAITWIEPEIQTLARLYQSQLSIVTPGWNEILTLLVAAAALGIGGAWLAAGRSLRSIEL